MLATGASCGGAQLDVQGAMAALRDTALPEWAKRELLKAFKAGMMQGLGARGSRGGHDG